MAHRRSERVADLLKKEISDIIRNEIKDPRIGFTTISKVDLSQDLRHAKVYISVLGSNEEREETILGLESAKGFIRSQVGRRVRLRHIPELLFRNDDSYIYAQRISEVMKEIEPELRHEEKPPNGNASSEEDSESG